MKSVDKFFKKLQSIQFDSYPKGVVPVCDRISGTSFFPGGDGLWKHENKIQDLKLGGIMIIGNNFDNVAGFKKSLSLGSEPINCPTWKNIRKLLQDAEIDLTDCFFTNVYVGLMESNSNVGMFPGAKSESFKQKCLELLEYQISEQKPKVILTLGRFVSPLLARLSPDLSSWINMQNFANLDQNGRQILANVHFCDGNVISNVVALTHPSQRHLNIKKRQYLNLIGNEAEIAMLHAAVG